MRWIAFRDQPGAAPGAVLSLPIGLGWRGGYLTSMTLDDLDRCVIETAARAKAAFAIWEHGSSLYGIAARATREPIRFVLNVDGSDDGELRDRCGIGASRARWRQQVAQMLADWSAVTPRTTDALEVDAVLRASGDPAAIAAAWCELLGLAVPVDRAPHQIDQAALARAELAAAAERRRARRLTPEPLW